MAVTQKRISRKDLVRVGAYAQTEGNFRIHKNGGYRFTFFFQQISDMRDLMKRVIDTEKVLDNRTYLQFYSKELYKDINSLGFYKFTQRDWNIPKVTMLSSSDKKEYFRAIVDALGNIDVDTYHGDNTPYVRIHSVNVESLKKLGSMFNGKYYQWQDRGVLQWKGKDAIDVLNYLDWEFYNFRNQRGAELIRTIKWSKFIW